MIIPDKEMNILLLLLLQLIDIMFVFNIIRMNQDEVSKFTLDNRLGGDSEFIHRKAIYRCVHHILIQHTDAGCVSSD